MRQVAPAFSKLVLLCCVGLFVLSILSLAGVGELCAQQDFNFNQGPQKEMSPAEVAIMLTIYAIVIAVSLAIHIFICYLLFTVLKAVPQQFRVMEPGMVWLLLIPCFSIIWIFFVYIQIPKSYQNYFRSIGRHDTGDCGEQLGLWYCICTCLCLIPCVNYIAGPAALIIMIIYLVKMFGLKSQLQMSLAQPGYGQTGYGQPGQPGFGPPKW